MKGRRTEKQVEQGGIVGLYHEKEDLLSWDSKESRPKDSVWGVCPDLLVYQV